MPYNACRILKFNPEDESAASVGKDLGGQHEMKYEDTVLAPMGGCMASLIVPITLLDLIQQMRS